MDEARVAMDEEIVAMDVAEAAESTNDHNTGSLCRFCHAPLQHVIVDLGMSPLCESFLEKHQLNRMERFYPLRVYVCKTCFLVQLDQYVDPEEIFTEYAYFSSYADAWLEHARRYTIGAADRFGLDQDSLVVELASNDGYLLQYFAEQDIPVLGVEPAANVARVAQDKGIPTRVEFFNETLALIMAREGEKADLIVANNVLAQVPNLNSFVEGMKVLLKPDGAITVEFPHLVRLMDENQFDTIYHEHFSYFSLLSAERIFAAHGLTIFDVEELPTHGGSLRIYACHTEGAAGRMSERVDDLRAREVSAGINRIDTYERFAEQVHETKRSLLRLLIEIKETGQSIAGYGAPGKGNTLLNYAGIGTDFLDYTVDRNPYKQGRFLPGTHIPIHAPEKIRETRPNYVMILPWNFKDEIIEQMDIVRSWDGRFIVPIPRATIIS